MTKLSIALKKHHRLVSALALVLAVAAIFWVVNSPAVVGAAAAERVLPIYSVKRQDKTIAISFDAAWGHEDTQTLIDILNKYGVKATFFVVGAWVDKYPESVKAIADAGDEVMNHSDDHAHFSKLSTEDITANINAANDKIEAVTGVRPALFRCPYGEYDDHVITAVKSMGMTAIQWSVDSLDWQGISAQKITERVLKNVQPGSIVLFHNAAEHTPEALPGILEALQKAGYNIVPISQLIVSGDYTIDSTGCQCPVSCVSPSPAASPAVSPTPTAACSKTPKA
ncbi:MAG: polysaccharide deacetylase family protein [Oscillospiraceae bacterium]|nr:polysaccharide deacetylase family protein [Oscillospiraceae bacterium]